MIREMFDLMYAANGIGLAANQVDLPFRLFIVNLAANPNEGEELVFINPVISRPKGNIEQEEGCLSLVGVYADVRRPETVVFNAYSLDGKEIDGTLSGMMARVVQHETDHLDGVLFVDRLSTTGQMDVADELSAFENEFHQARERGAIPDDSQIAQRLLELEKEFC